MGGWYSGTQLDEQQRGGQAMKGSLRKSQKSLWWLMRNKVEVEDGLGCELEQFWQELLGLSDVSVEMK